jgi:hypothetical protein
MAEIRKFIYKDKHVHVTINQDGSNYVGIVDIDGMTLGADKVSAQATSADGAFALCKRRAEEMIDGQEKL